MLLKNRLLLFALLIYSASYTQSNPLDVLVAYDYIETSNWGGSDWMSDIPTSGRYEIYSASPPASTVLFGAGNNNFEFDWYDLPNRVVDPLKDHYFQMKLSASDKTNFFSFFPTGMDTNDFVIIQLSTDGGINYNDEIKITGNNDAIWDFNSNGSIFDLSGTGLSIFTPSGGGDRTSMGDGYSDINLYIGMGVSNIALRIYVQSNSLGEDWWMDDFELWEVNSNPLPVELSYFEGTAFPDYNHIEWQTYSEHNSSHFLLEKSLNGETWDILSTIPASGNSTEIINYSQLDYSINNNIYYRLTQFDIDGEFEIFGPIFIQRNIIERKPVKYINSIGQEINPYNSKGLIITIYDDGSIIKTIK
jgi:hypothetical protein